MKLPRDLSGQDLAKSLCLHWNYSQVHQTGSHIILDTEEPRHQRIAIPAHRDLRIGTLNNILKSVARHKFINSQAILDRL
ncbi:MAG: type II toxin-antitoxin system HicA family toxin [Candidatus Omnitrophica bacterium]|nr:type II toxin-antitoxin system HicA family toxin [Candidatus Omnitrophota bacterium]